MKRILILHELVTGSRRTNRDHIYSFAKYAPGNLYVYHHIHAPLTDALKSFPFDGIIMNYCFLGNRTATTDTIRERYRFLADHPAKKIAVVQDDYTYHQALDDWLLEMKVDVIYSPIQENLEILYPRNWSQAKFREGLTGYTDNAQLAELETYAKPFDERTIDVGTRVRHLPPIYGRYGKRKGESAVGFGKAADKAGFKVDMSTDPKDVLLGSRWLQFLGDCKFTLGSKGGASIADPYGKIAKKVSEYLAGHPDAGFDAVANNCFPGMDDKYVFAGVSPRLFESAALRTCQILIRDNYVGGIEPYTDYIPLDEDLSNLDEVFALMRDEKTVKSMIDSCYAKLIASNQFDYSAFVADVLDQTVDSGRAWSEEEQSALDTHFALLEPFTRLREKYGGAWETGLKTLIARFVKANIAHVPYEMAQWPLDFVCNSAFAAQHSAAPKIHNRLVSVLSDFYEYARNDPESLQDMRTIFESLANGELRPDSYGWHTSLFLWWDMCEFIYEPPAAKHTSKQVEAN